MQCIQYMNAKYEATAAEPHADSWVDKTLDS